VTTTRQPAVAGLFYPEDAKELNQAVRDYLRPALEGASTTPPKALIVPHAGYVYSGPVAAAAYAEVWKVRETIKRVVLMGPSHRVPLEGLAAPSADAFLTPLGPVRIDSEAITQVLLLPQVSVLDAAHAQEHSLEVHLPFLQQVLGQFLLVPLVAGSASTDDIAQVLEALWGGPETLIVISSDLSHYLDYETARELDAATSRAIEQLEPGRIAPDAACGLLPVRGLLTVARRFGLRGRTVDLRNSGDTAGPRDQVVGYGAYAFT
jgi:AmmeMemoRadiSam system protein B